MGYWGELHQNVLKTKKYNPQLLYPIQSSGNLSHMWDLTMDCMEKYGVGVIDPTKIEEFYNDYHSYLVSQSVDGYQSGRTKCSRDNRRKLLWPCHWHDSSTEHLKILYPEIFKITA